MIDEEAVETVPPEDWLPPPGVVRHSGAPLEVQARFFEPPPAEIGDVRTAESDCNRGSKPMSINTRLFFVALTSAIAAFVTSWVCEHWQVKGPVFVNLVTTGVALLGALIAWLGTQFRKTCSYVGSRGVARFTCSGNARNITKRELYVFDPAHELRTTVTMHYHNGVYTGTRYQYRWTTQENAKAFTLAGSHNSKKDQPPPGNAFHLARAAEDAWSDYRYAFAREQILSGSEVVFRASGRDHVRVGLGYVVIVQGKQELPIDLAQIGDVSVDKGTLTFALKDSKKGFLGIGRSGIYQMPYSSIGNGRVLMYLTLGMLHQVENSGPDEG